MREVGQEAGVESGQEYRELVYASIRAALLVAATRKDYEVIVEQCESIAGYRDVDEICGDVRGKMELLRGKPDLDEELGKRKAERRGKLKRVGVTLVVVGALAGVVWGIGALQRRAWGGRYESMAAANRRVLEQYGGKEYEVAQRGYGGKRYHEAYDQLVLAVRRALDRRREAELAERRRLAAEAAERKRQAEEAERQRLAKLAEEQERQRQEAERKRLAEEEERRRLAAEAVERQWKAEEAERQRLAKLAEERERQRQETERQRLAGEEERRRRVAEAGRKLAGGLNKNAQVDAGEVERKRLAEHAERKKASAQVLKSLADSTESGPKPLVAMRSDRMDSDTFWAWAVQRNTPQSFRCFAFHFPRDARAREALARWESLDLQAFSTNRSEFAYKRFRAMHPDAVIPPGMTVNREKQRDPASPRLVYSLPESDVARRASDVLLEGLADAKASLRALAAQGLGEIRAVQAVEPLMDALKDESRDVKAAAAAALGDIGDKRAENALVEAIKDDDWRITAAARKIAPERVYEAFIGDIESTNKWTRLKVVRALGQSGDPRAVKVLTECLGDSDPFVCGAAAEAIGSYSNLAVPRALLQALRSRSDHVRRSAVGSVGKFSDGEAEDALIAAFDDPGSDVFTRLAIARALIDRGTTRGLDFVFNAMEKSRLADDQGPLVDDLVKVDKSRTYAVFLSSCRDTKKFWTVRNSAAGFLARINPASAVKDLSPLLRDANEFVRKDVIRTLGGIGNPEAVPALMDVARTDSETYTRSLAIEAVGAIGDPVVVRDLIGLMKAPDPYLRSAVAKSLGAIGDARAIDALADGFTDRSGKAWQRVACAVALAKMDREHALRLLLTELDSTDTEVISAVATGLGEIGDPRAAGPLTALLSHENYSVRNTAGHALGLLQGVEPEVEASMVASMQGSGGSGQAVLGHALLKRGDPRGVPIMVEAKQYTYRSQAIERVSDVRCVEELVRLLARGKDLKREAETALARIVSQHGMQPLLDMLSVEESLLRVASAELIAKLLFKDLDEAYLERIAGGATAEMRGRTLGSVEVPGELERALLDPESGVRIHSALAIVRMLGHLEGSDSPRSARGDKEGLTPGSTMLVGGLWHWSAPGGNPADIYMQMLPDGAVRYGYSVGETNRYANAKWRLSSNELVLDFNNGYSLDTFPFSQFTAGVWHGTSTTTRGPITMRRR